MSVVYREWTPPPALAATVEALWTLQASADGEAPAERVLPDGSPELILRLGDPMEHLPDGNLPVRQPAVMFVGQLTGPFRIRATGRADLLGVRFRPGGAATLFREPQHRLNDAGVALDELAPALAADLGRRPQDVSTPAERVDAVAGVLARHAGRGPSTVAEAAWRLVANWGQRSLDRLRDDTGLGHRQLERRFLDEVGIRPKLLARICRFQRVFAAFEQQPASWAAVAADCGYYDSSHLIRDFREFTGETPTRLMEEEHQLTLTFTRAGRTSDSSKTGTPAAASLPGS